MLRYQILHKTALVITPLNLCTCIPQPPHINASKQFPKQQKRKNKRKKEDKGKGRKLVNLQTVKLIYSSYTLP